MKAEIRSIVDINQTAADFKSSIVLRVSDTKFVDVKSILGLSITLYKNLAYKLEIHGPDEEAKSAMIDVFNKYHLNVEVNR
jgi:phosphocarrier protein